MVSGAAADRRTAKSKAVELALPRNRAIRCAAEAATTSRVLSRGAVSSATRDHNCCPAINLLHGAKNLGANSSTGIGGVAGKGSATPGGARTDQEVFGTAGRSV